jgi:hypothetical protein
VHRFNPDTRSGDVVTDGGELLPFTTATLDSSPFRLLRPGQRLTVTVGGAGKDAYVTAVALGGVGVVPDTPSRP